MKKIYILVIALTSIFSVHTFMLAGSHNFKFETKEGLQHYFIKKYEKEINKLDNVEKEEILTLISGQAENLYNLNEELEDTREKLKCMAFTSDTKANALEELGKKMVQQREEIYKELIKAEEIIKSKLGLEPKYFKHKRKMMRQYSECIKTIQDEQVV